MKSRNFPTVRWANSEKSFQFLHPTQIFAGFCEDYKRMIINARHELILIRSRSDNNSLIGSPILEPEIELLKCNDGCLM